jgi:hypothetical protein
MSVTTAVTNMGLRKFSVPGFTTMSADPLVTKTKSVKQVNADDRSKNFDSAAKFGVVITENGTARPGSIVITTTATLLAAQKIAIVDMSASFTLTLAALAGLAVGETVHILVRSRTGAWTLTVDGSGAETINGSANATISTTGGILRIKKSSTTNWVTATV